MKNQEEKKDTWYWVIIVAAFALLALGCSRETTSTFEQCFPEYTKEKPANCDLIDRTTGKPLCN